MPFSTARSLVAVAVAVLGLSLTACGGKAVSFSPVGAQSSPGASATGAGVSAGEDGGAAVSGGGGVSVSGGPGGVKVEAPGVTVSGGSDGVNVEADGSAAGAGETGKIVIGSAEDRIILSVDTSVARTPDEQAAAKAYRRYYELRVRGAHDGKINVAALSKVAAGDAADEALSQLRSGTKVVGDIAMNLASVEVDAGRASVVTCVSIQGKEIDLKGDVVDEAVGSYQWNTELKRFGTSWKVTTSVQDDRAATCG